MVNPRNKSIAINKKIIEALDKMLAHDVWEKSLFLKNTAKQFRNIRERAQQLLINAMGPAGVIDSQHVSLEKAGFTPVYISIYQADGNNLQKWFTTLKSLVEFSISRPVYRSEEHVKAMIRSKSDALREGYAVVLVKDEDILVQPSYRVTTDRLGHELLTLKVHAVKVENIIDFVHGEKHYRLNENGLLLAK